MEMTEVMQLIASLGIPNVVEIYIIYVNREQSSKHADEVKGMTEAINELKIVLQKLIDKIGGEE